MTPPAAAEKLRLGGFVRALIALALAFCVEIGAHFALGGGGAVAGEQRARSLSGNPDVVRLQLRTGADLAELAAVSADNPQPPGMAIPYLALIDGLLLMLLAVMVLNLLASRRAAGRGQGVVTPETIGRTQGVITVVLMVVVIVGAIVLALLALARLVLMVTLFVSAPFGTLAYFLLFGDFDSGGATIALAAVMALKLAFCLQLVLGQQRFLQLKGFVALVATSLLCTVLVGFLHGIVPSVLTSITDAIAALVIAVVAIVWALVLLIGGAIGAVKAIA
jgi:hypothetical protein